MACLCKIVPTETQGGEVVDPCSLSMGGERMSLPAKDHWDYRIVAVIQLARADVKQRASDLAREVDLSRSRLQHLFKSETGITLRQYLLRRKLREASRLLAGTNLRINEIAYAIGYQHTPSFVRAFRQRYSETPGEFRQNHCQFSHFVPPSV